jgi:hypothetical protein
MATDGETFLSDITRHWELGEEEIARRLSRYGRVQYSMMIWTIWPDDDEEFCRLTDFSLCERKYGMFNIVAHQLSRVDRLLRS